MADTITQPEIERQLGQPKIRPWRELALFAGLFMELSWIAMWVRFILQLEQRMPYITVLIILSLVVVMLYTLAILMDWFNIKIVVRRVILGISLLLCIVITMKALLGSTGGFDLWEILSRPVRTFQDMADLIPAEFTLIMLVLFLAWRAFARVGAHIESVTLIAGFRIGVFAFFFYAFSGAWHDSTPLLALTIFLFTGLLAMSASRLAVLGQLRGGQSIPFDRRWLVGILLSILAMVSLALLVALGMGGRGFEIISRAFSVLIYFIVLLLSPLLWLVMQLVIWLGQLLNLGNLIASLLELIKTIQQFIDNILMTFERWFAGLDQDIARKIGQWLMFSRPILVWVTILVFALIVLLSLHKTVRRHERDLDEQENEALLHQKDLIDLLRDALRRGLGRLQDELDKMIRLSQARRLFAAARIRRIYARMLNMSEQLGQTRPVASTPLEFLPTLERTFPALNAELIMITNAYLRIRYGELPESGDEVAQVEMAWGRVRQKGLEQLRERKKTRAA